MCRQSGKFRAVVDYAKEAFYALKDSTLFLNSSEEESNEGGLVSFLVGDVKPSAYGLVVKPCGLKKYGKWEAMSRSREERKRKKADKDDPAYVPEDTRQKHRNNKPNPASNKKSAGDCGFDVSFVFLFFSIPFLMNSSNI